MLRDPVCVLRGSWGKADSWGWDVGCPLICVRLAGGKEKVCTVLEGRNQEQSLENLQPGGQKEDFSGTGTLREQSRLE